MEQELISKKELLELYGISYGALYRWKRKGLIPEDWFIKKATSTGQETFFPAEAVCERIELILSQKEDVLLDDLANRLTEYWAKPYPYATGTLKKTTATIRANAVEVTVEVLDTKDLTTVLAYQSFQFDYQYKNGKWVFTQFPHIQ